VDIGITAAHLCLAREDEGLGTCIIGWFNESKVRKLLNIPSGKRVLLDIVVGYSLQPDRPKKRKEKDKVISFNSTNKKGGRIYTPLSFYQLNVTSPF
jgi:nitroreductase